MKGHIVHEASDNQWESRMKTRIWHQSITDLTLLPGYSNMLAEHAKVACDPDTTVDLHGVMPGTYPPGMAPIEMARYPWSSTLRSLQIVENIMQAEREGYDAVAISCFSDPGLEEARGLVDIPVVSSLETALLVSSTIGRSFGLIALDKNQAQTQRLLVKSYGFADKVLVITELEPPLTELELDKAYKNPREFAERFERQARSLIAQGVDVIIPAEGVLNTVLVRSGIDSVDGVPVLDSYGAVLSYAEMLARMRRRCGLHTGRGHAYRRPPQEMVAHLRDVTIQAMTSAKK
jgi:Asp/Glu/hydantoin racemase